MKELIRKISILFTSLLLLVAGMVSAQNNFTQQTDKVIFLNGTAKEGKVIAFADDKIRFVYKGETVNYEFNKKEIEKIEYASGRTEVITERKAAEVSVSPISAKNRVAVMPMIYIGDGNDDRSEEMRFQLQDIVITYLSKSAAELKLADATEINALLLKNGINDENIRQYTPKELAALLHVEYVIMGSVLQDNGNLVTITNNHNTQRQTIEQRGPHDNEIRITSRNNTNGSYVTKQNIQTQVSLSIYNETGEKIYSRSRQSIWTEPDAYKNALHFLLKRTPLYKR